MHSEVKLKLYKLCLTLVTIEMKHTDKMCMTNSNVLMYNFNYV